MVILVPVKFEHTVAGPQRLVESDEQTTIPLEGVPAAEGPWAVEGGKPLAGPQYIITDTLLG